MSTASSRASLPSAPVAQLVGHDGPVNAVCFTADGKYCLTAGYDRTVRLWNPTRRDPSYSPGGVDGDGLPPGSSSSASSEPPHALPIQTYSDGHTHPVSSVSIDGGSTTLLSSSDRALVVTDVVTRAVKRRLHGARGHAARINDVASGPGAESYLSASYDGTVRVWDGRSRSGDPVQVLDEAKDSVSAVEVAPSASDDGGGGGGGGSGSPEILAASVDGTLRTYDLRRGQVRCDDVGDAVTGFAVSRDRQCVAVSCLDGTIRLLERSTGELLQTYAGGHAAGNYGLGCDVSADDALVVSGSEDGAVAIYDLIDGSVARRLERHGKPTCAVAAHPQREWRSVVISASYDGGALVWSNKADASRWG